MSETIYLVMEQGFDYNDEYYFRTEGGHPNSFFTNKKKAEEACAKKNLAEFKRIINSNEIREYTSDGFDGLISENTVEDELDFEEGIFKTLFGMTAWEWWKNDCYVGEDTFKVEPTEEQWLRLMKCFNLDFYSVVTVQKG